MSGKPQYDEDEVIAAAVNVFWTHGYAAASVNDLIAATGLSRSSIYQRFGDKDGLFLEALETYTDRVLRRMGAISGGTARDKIEALLRAFLPGKLASKRPAGCLIARSCAEAADLSPAGQAAALAAIKRQRGVIEGILQEGVVAGELAKGTEIEALALYYFAMLQAVVNFPHTGASSDNLARVIDVAMAAWPTKATAVKR
jgi:AcrR family transcriptional regulator